MSTENDTVEHTRSRKRVFVGAGIASVVVLGAGAAALWLVPGQAEDPTTDPVVVVKPADPAPTTEPGEIEDTSATDVIAHVLAIPIQPVETAEDLDTLMGNVASGGYLRELESQWQELVANGWSVEGTPTVVSAEVTEASDSQATVVACVDSSNVRILDAAGVAIGAASTVRALNVYTLEQSGDGIWRITSHSFPNDPAC